MKLNRLGLAALAVALMAIETLGMTPRRAVTINTKTATPNPAIVGSNTLFAVTTTGIPAGVLSYRWTFGDGTQSNAGAFSITANTFNHTYAAPGHYTVTIEVQDGLATVTDTFPLTAHRPLTPLKPTNSSTIIFDSTNNRVWVVNPDQDTVSTILTPANTVTELPVGRNPRTLAQAADGTIWVVSQGHPSISILQPTSPFTLLHVIPLPHGSMPYGIAMTPDGSAAYVSLQGSGGVQMFSTSTRALLAASAVPLSARGVSVTSNGRVLVTRFISPQSTDPTLVFSSAAFLAQNHGEVVELSPSLGFVRTFNLAIDPGPGGPNPDFGGNTPPTADSSRGVPNYITSLVITPDGRRAWVPSKKDNVQRGTGPGRDNRDTGSSGAEVTYRAIVSSLDLATTNAEVLAERVDVDNNEMPQAACTSPLGDYIFIALQGTNRIQVRDAYNMAVPRNGFGDPSGTTTTNGLSPQGLVIDPVSKKLYVQNYMGRTVSVIDVTAALASNGAGFTLPAPSAVINTLTGADLLAAQVLLGKRVFYNAADPRMSLNGYISCAGCHLDGGSDMRVWDFTIRNEGFRNTVLLQGRAGTGHGNVHWSANFNEIQDFDNDVYFHFHANAAPPGPALSSFTTNPAHPMLGINNALRDGDLDAMAAYVTSLTKVPRSPFRGIDGALTPLGAAGEAVFKTKNCQRCHTGRNFTDSAVGTNSAVLDPVAPPPANTPILHDVGTLKPTSGKRLNGGLVPNDGLTLPGLDTPTLKGVWETAPFFHDGSAATLADVFAVTGVAATKHFGGVLTPSEQASLVQYMLEVDEIDSPPVPSTQVNTVSVTSVSTARPYSLGTALANGLPFIDRSYQINALSANLNNKILVRTAEDDKAVAATSHVVLTFANPGLTWRVYVCYDSRATTRPDWLSVANGWTVSAETITLKNPALTMTVLEHDVAGPGTLTLGGNLATGAAGALRNYFAIVRTLTGTQTFEEGPLSQTEWVHEQDADGDGLRDEYEVVTATTIAGLTPWVPNSVAVGLSDEDQLSGGVTLFSLQPPLVTGGIGGGGGGGGGGCGLGGLEFLIPLLGLRLVRRRRPTTA